MKQCIWAS